MSRFKKIQTQADRVKNSLQAKRGQPPISIDQRRELILEAGPVQRYLGMRRVLREQGDSETLMAEMDKIWSRLTTREKEAINYEEEVNGKGDL